MMSEFIGKFLWYFKTSFEMNFVVSCCGSILQLTFEAIRGSSWNGDIAIDVIVLTSAACSKQQFKIVLELKLPPLRDMFSFLQVN